MTYNDQRHREIEDIILRLTDEKMRAEHDKNQAYKERDQLVCLLTRLLPCNNCWLERHPDSDAEWEDDWRWIVFVELPTGQASWHIHDSELHWFDHLGRREPIKPSWDGHTTQEKYERVMSVKPCDVAAGWLRKR